MLTEDWYPFRRHLAIGTDGTLTRNGEVDIFDADTGVPVETRYPSAPGQDRGTGAVMGSVAVQEFATVEFEARATEVYGQSGDLSPIKMQSPEGMVSEAVKRFAAAGVGDAGVAALLAQMDSETYAQAVELIEQIAPDAGGVSSWNDLQDVPVELTKPVGGLEPGDGVQFVKTGPSVVMKVEPRLSQANLDATYAGRSEVAALAADALAADPTIAPALAAAASTAVDEVIAAGPVGNLTWLGEYESGETYKVNALVGHHGEMWLKTTPPATATVEDFNYILNPRFANNRQNWSVPAGVFPVPTAPTIRLDITADKAPNSLLFQQTAGTGGTATAVGEVWSTAYLVTNPGAAGVAVRADLFFTGKTVAGPSTTVGPGATVRVTASGTAPTVGAAVSTRFYSGDSLIPSGSSVVLTEPVLHRAPTPGPYWDGNTPDTEGVVYEWSGAVDNSASRRATTSVVPDNAPALGSTGWRLWTSTSGAIDRAPLTMPVATVTSVPSNDIPAALSADRTHAWAAAGSTLRVTHDDGATWTTIRVFSGESIEAVREVIGGELLVFVLNVAANRRRVYRSTGYRTLGPDATWQMVMETRAPGIKFTSAWSISRNGDALVLIGEYGPKFGQLWVGETVAEGENARYLYGSFDGGLTWRTLFDLNAYLTAAAVSINGHHLHGVAWDPWWDRIWVSYGDDTDAIIYSDDLGATWRHAAGTAALSSGTQVVGILAMPKAILFGSDTGPSGVMRIDRAHGKDAGTYPLDVAYTPADPGHLCQAITRADRPGNDAPAFFGFSSEGTAARSYVVGTFDGFEFVLIWRDPVAQSAGYGVRSVIGPTLRGQLVIGSNDQKVAGMWSKVTLPAPGY